MSEHQLNATCPNCGKASHCQYVSGDPDHECWCIDMPIDPEKLKLQSSQAPTKDCFCRMCLSSLE